MAIPKYLRVWKLNPRWVAAQEPTLKTIKVDDFLTGNIVPIRKVDRVDRKTYRDTLARLALAAYRSGYGKGKKLYVSSSYRSVAEQAHLYQLYLAGQGPLAAKPGASAHNHGRALDVPNVRETHPLIDECRKMGLKDDVPGEKWHLTNYN